MPSQTKKITKPKPKSRGGMPSTSLPTHLRPQSLSTLARSPQRSTSSQSPQRHTSPMSPSSNQKITLPTLGHYNIQKVKYISEDQRNELIKFEKEVYDRHKISLNSLNAFTKKREQLFMNVFKTQIRYNDEIDMKIFDYKKEYYRENKGLDPKTGFYLRAEQRP
jgi:hypothetical protein